MNNDSMLSIASQIAAAMWSNPQIVTNLPPWEEDQKVLANDIAKLAAFAARCVVDAVNEGKA